jgi:ribokinase
MLANRYLDSDTFIGTYGMEYVKRKRQSGDFDIEKAIRRACRASSRTIERIGAQESIPWSDEIGE